MGNNEGGFRWGSLAVLIGAALILVGVADRATTEPIDIQVVQLHNDQAQTASGCESRGPSWHFVLAPNNGTFAFHSISLMVSGVLYEFDAGDLIRNSGQRDNVFVRVPDGRTVGDLQAAGSFAEVTPGSAERSVRFVLSDVCPGGGATTTTTSSSTSVPHSTTTTSVPHSTTSTSTSVPHSTTSTSTSVPHSTTSTSTSVPESTTSTSTSVPDSTTSTTSVPESTTSTSTSVPESTTTSIPVGATTTTTVPDTTTTTTAPSSTTTTSVEQGVPTTTSTSTTSTSTTTTVPKTSTTSPATTTTVVKQSVPTGSDAARPLLMIGAILVILGASALLGAHVRSTEPR